jgi:hypothetical protein
VRREAQRRERSLEQALSMVWEQSLDALIHDLDELGNRVLSQLSSFSGPRSRS